jgi:hypothetical protein
MIKKSVHEAELIHGMQRELRGFEKNAAMENLPKAANYLQAAMEIFEASGLTVQADKVLNILAKIAKEDKEKERHNSDKIEFTSLLNKNPDKKHHVPEKHISFESMLSDDQDAKKSKKAPSDPHTKGLTPERMVENLKHHGIVFNMADDGKADDMLEADVLDEQLEVTEPHHSEKGFEDEEDGKVKTAAKYGQQSAPTATPAATATPAPTAPTAKAPAAPAAAAAVPAQTPAEAAAAAAAKKAALEAAKAAATAAKAAAAAAATAATDAAEKLKSLETGASLRALLSKYSDNAAPSAHVRSWDPSAKETPSSQKPTINHVEGNVGTDRKATDAEPGVGVDAPSHKSTDPSPGIGVDAPSHSATDATVGEGVDAPSHKATDETPGKGVDAPSRKATDSKSGDSSDARTAGGTPTAGGAPIDDEKTPTAGVGSSDVRSPTSTEVRSPTSTEVRSPTSTEVRSPTSTEVRSPTSTSTEVRSPTSTSTEAYTADNFTATVTGGAGDGANTTVNIYLTPPTTPKTNPNVPQVSKDKKAAMNYLMAKYG